MKSVRLVLSFLAAFVSTTPGAIAQASATPASVTLAGLRSSGNTGSFKAAQYAPDGSLILLYDQGDGLRILKMDASAIDVTAQVQAGATGDSGVAMAMDPAGDVYVAGTSSSGALAGTSGVPYPSAADTTTNSFVAKFDPNLRLLYLTFLGAGRTVVAGVAATSDAVFVTGVTYSTAFPVTWRALAQAPAPGSYGNGFVERFSADGAAVGYATYLTGAAGDTVPAGIVADSADDAFVTGQTSATAFPTLAALQPSIVGPASGFLTELTPAGDGIVFSTYIAGTGLTSLALDATTNTLLLSGNVSLGQFPVATVAGPIANTPYQTLLRLSVDGQSLTQSVLLVPGTASFATAGPNGTAWISGALGPPSFDESSAQAAMPGGSFLLHVTQSGVLDQLLRFGGSPTTNPGYATLTSNLAAPALNAAGTAIALPGTVDAVVDSSLRASQHFDLPLTSPTAALPNSVADLLPTSCTATSECQGSGALLSLINTGETAAATLTLSSDDSPNFTLRNAGPVAATGIVVIAPGYTVAADCGSTLAPLAQCGIALSGSGPGPITISASNSAAVSVPVASASASPGALSFSTTEVDFGIVTADSSPVNRALTVTNLSSTTQNFTSIADAAPTTPPYTLAETGGTCLGANGTHTLAADSACTLILALSASPLPANDGAVHAFWKIGSRDIAVTGIAQAAELSVSAEVIDFGVQLTTAGTPLPRYLYLSNNSGASIAHAAVALPANSPFAVTDACPSSLEPGSVCQIALTYAEANAPAKDGATLPLDQGISVLISGETLAPPVPGSVPNANLSVTSTSLNFATPVIVTEVSTETQVLSVTNRGTVAMPLNASVTPEFLLSDSCGSTLAAGATCDLVIQFVPSQPGVREGLLTLGSGGTFAPILVSLSGTATALLSPDSETLALGQTSVGEPAVQWYRIQASPGTLTASVTGSGFGVAVVEDDGDGHGTLPADAFASTATVTCSNCWLGVQFYPQTAGPANTALTLSTVAGGNPEVLAVTATGVAVQGLVLSAPGPDFGTVPLGSTCAPETFTLANLLSPAAATSITGVSATGDFHILSNTTGGASCSGTLASTASCFIEVSFAPTAIGRRTGSLTIQTSSGVVTAALSGSGGDGEGLSLSPVSLTFNNSPGSSATQQVLTLGNSGSTSIIIGQITSSNPAFTTSSSCATLAAAATCTVSVSFAPGTAEVTGSLTIAVSTMVNGELSNATYTVPLAGTYTASGTGLLLLPSQADFGAQASGTIGQTRQFTLTNTTQAAETVSLTVPAQFPLATPFTCTTLAPGATCTFAVSFLPETGGALTGSLVARATSSAGSSTAQAIGYLLGYGKAAGRLAISGQLSTDPSVNFGAVNSGGSAQQTFSLTNSGTGPLTVRRVLSAAPFQAATTCGAAMLPGVSCTVTVTYAPILQSAGATGSVLPRTDAGTLVIESDAASSPDTLGLVGTVNAVAAGNAPSAISLASYQLSEGALTFSNVQVGDQSEPQTLTLLNNGTKTVSIAAVLAPQDFVATTTCAELLPGASCSIGVTFTPGSTASSPLRVGTLEIQSNAPDPLEFVSLLGMSTAAPLQISPEALDFGTVDVPGSGQLPVTVTNSASLPITFGKASATGDYSVTAGTCPPPGAALPAGQSCALMVTFTPSTTGTRAGTLNVTSDATQLALTVSLTGVGAEASLRVSPGALAFGDISVGASAMKQIDLNNAGTGGLSGIAVVLSGPNAADFAITTPCPTTTLSPDAGCTMAVTFTPTAGGNRTATLVISSSDPSGPTTVPLGGTGTQAGSLLLTVNGTSAASATVAAGMPATYALMLAPQNGFAGMAALTCTPLSAAPYAGCSLLSSQLNLTAGAQGSTATITTVNGAITSSQLAPLGMIFLAPLSWLLRRRARSNLGALYPVVILIAGALACLGMSGCGGPGNDGLNLTPAGTYKYQVTANSVSGVETSSTVTLTLVVQ